MMAGLTVVMNSKSILILVFVAMAATAGIYFWQNFAIGPALDQNTSSDGLQDVILLPSVKGCAETDDRMTTRASEGGTEQEPKIEAVGNEVVCSRAMNHLCCRKAEITKETTESAINIYEVWSGIGCRCMCFSEIKAVLKDVPPGTYTVNVYAKGTEPLTEAPMEQALVISREITVR